MEVASEVAFDEDFAGVVTPFMLCFGLFFFFQIRVSDLDTDWICLFAVFSKFLSWSQKVSMPLKTREKSSK